MSLQLLSYRAVVLTGRLSLLRPNGEVEMKSRPLRLPLPATMDNDASLDTDGRRLDDKNDKVVVERCDGRE